MKMIKTKTLYKMDAKFSDILYYAAAYIDWQKRPIEVTPQALKKMRNGYNTALKLKAIIKP